MLSSEKINELKNWLSENKIRFEENLPSKHTDLIYDLFIFRYNTVVHIQEEPGDSDEYYDAISARHRTVFCRKQDTPETLINKVKSIIEFADDVISRRHEKYRKKRNNILMNCELRVAAMERKLDSRIEEAVANAVNDIKQNQQEEPKRKRQRIVHAEPIFKM